MKKMYIKSILPEKCRNGKITFLYHNVISTFQIREIISNNVNRVKIRFASIRNKSNGKSHLPCVR